MQNFTFPIGYHKMHKTKIIDFQLNRWYSFGYARLKDMQEAAVKINKLEDWEDEMVRQAQNAMSEQRMINAAFYYRAAEFFTFPHSPNKNLLYEKFIDLFYKHVFEQEIHERHLVPYAGTYLPALKIPSAKSPYKGTMVVHGGFDSYIEEFYSLACYFSSLGYDVILFEGPGQGAALKKYNLPLTYEWEKPAQAVLEYFKLEDVTWLGISMGGWLCFRAAAFEPRIKRVIASSIAFDYLQIPPSFIKTIAEFLFKFPGLMNYLSDIKIKRMPQEKWGIYNLMYITKTNTAYAAGKKIIEFNEKNLHSELVKQDVLILTGAEDHFIPLKMHYKQVAALKNAKSITERIFTKEEQGHNHCQVGNFGLALDVMANWISEKTE